MKCIFVILFLLPQLLYAKTIFEPSLGVSTGSLSKTFDVGSTIPLGGTVEGTFSALNVGARYGITREYIQVMAVVDAFWIKTDSNVGELSTKFKASTLDSDFSIGLGIGYEWNIPLRTYVILGVPNSAVEISYFFIEELLIGLKYTKIKTPLAGVDVSVNTYGLTVSVPFEFNYPSYWWRKKDWE